MSQASFQTAPPCCQNLSPPCAQSITTLATGGVKMYEAGCGPDTPASLYIFNLPTLVYIPSIYSMSVWLVCRLLWCADWHTVCIHSGMMISVCSWCWRGRRQFAAQPQLRHAYSHGLCPFHARFELLKFENEMKKIRPNIYTLDNPMSNPTDLRQPV